MEDMPRSHATTIKGQICLEISGGDGLRAGYLNSGCTLLSAREISERLYFEIRIELQVAKIVQKFPRGPLGVSA